MDYVEIYTSEFLVSGRLRVISGALVSNLSLSQLSPLFLDKIELSLRIYGDDVKADMLFIDSDCFLGFWGDDNYNFYMLLLLVKFFYYWAFDYGVINVRCPVKDAISIFSGKAFFINCFDPIDASVFNSEAVTTLL